MPHMNKYVRGIVTTVRKMVGEKVGVGDEKIADTFAVERNISLFV